MADSSQDFIEKMSTGALKTIMDYNNFRLAPEFDRKASAAFIRPNETLDHALQNARASGLPPINVLPMAAQHLSVLTRLMGAKSVLEIGTLGGYSSIVFAQAGARVTSVEISPKHRDVALQNTAGLDVDVRLGAALDVLPKLAAEGCKFDLVFIDADFDEQWEHFDWAVKLTKSGGGILLDDVVPTMIKNGEVGFGDDAKGRSLKEETVLEKIGRDGRVRASFVPVVQHMQPVLPDPLMNGYVLAVVE